MGGGGGDGMRRASAGGMHAISFLLKRAHLCSTNEGQRLLYAVPGMTPARFDILCFARQGGIRQKIPELAFTTQKRIREGLGLSGSVISRMLKRLEELGWIERHRDYSDARVKTVMLTKLGLRKIWEAMRLIFRGRPLAKHYEWVARRLRPNDHVLDSLDHLYDTLDMVALSFDDGAWFYYDTGSRRRPPFWARLPLQRKVEEDWGDLGPRIIDPPEPYPSPYQKWVAPLIRDRAALEKAQRSRDYVRIG